MGQNACVLSDDQAVEILRNLNQRGYSVRDLEKLLGVGKSTIHRVLKGLQKPPDKLRAKLCEAVPEEELLKVLKGRDLLMMYGLIDSEGRLNEAIVLALIYELMQDEALKDEVLNYILKYYKKDIQERLSEALPKIELRWSEDFEKRLTEKKPKPISERTLRDYRNIWFKCLEDKTLGWHLLKQLESSQMLRRDGEYHPTSWPRQIFRHYVRYLYAAGKLDYDIYTRLLLAIPGRRYGHKLSQKAIEVEEVARSLQVLKDRRPDIYTLYLFMLYPAVRFEHALRLFEEWNPDERLYVSYLSRNVKRLECFDAFCKYYMGKETDKKPAGFAYFPKRLLTLIEQYREKLPNRRRIERIVSILGILKPKMVRVFALREMKAVFGDTDAWRFMTSKFGELSVSARHYLDLLQEADRLYPSYIEHIENKLGSAL